jgi:hypothetical protein
VATNCQGYGPSTQIGRGASRLQETIERKYNTMAKILPKTHFDTKEMSLQGRNVSFVARPMPHIFSLESFHDPCSRQNERVVNDDDDDVVV